MKKIFKCSLVIIKGRKFLINRKSKNSLFLMPGGKPELGENDIGCLSREILEEHKCKVVKSSLKFLGYFEDKAANEIDTMISMNVYTGKIKGKLIPSSEIIEQRWFGRNDDKGILSPIIKNKILPYLIENEYV